jgi:hypothetical protein
LVGELAFQTAANSDHFGLSELTVQTRTFGLRHLKKIIFRHPLKVLVEGALKFIEILHNDKNCESQKKCRLLEDFIEILHNDNWRRFQELTGISPSNQQRAATFTEASYQRTFSFIELMSGLKIAAVRGGF